MKKITLSVYEKLTPKQRVIACIEAAARGDEDERLRLIESCPRKSYTQLDLQFTDKMEAMMHLGMAIESDLRECVLLFLLRLRMDGAIALESLQNFANIRDAWSKTLESLGIDERAMAAAGPPSSLAFPLVEDLIPEPETDKSEALSTEMLSFLER